MDMTSMRLSHTSHMIVNACALFGVLRSSFARCMFIEIQHVVCPVQMSY